MFEPSQPKLQLDAPRVALRVYKTTPKQRAAWKTRRNRIKAGGGEAYQSATYEEALRVAKYLAKRPVAP